MSNISKNVSTKLSTIVKAQQAKNEEVIEPILDPKNMKAIFRFKNSAFLEDSDDYIYHIYLSCGITEGILKNAYSSNIVCEIENIHVSKNKEDAYFDLSIRLVKK